MNAIYDFELIVDNIFGVYLDSTTGFHLTLEETRKRQEKTIEMFKSSQPELANQEYIDSTAFLYGLGNPNAPDCVVLHRCTQLEYKKRNSKNGDNYKFIGNMSIISIYHYWEDFYRAQIADLFGKKKNEIISLIMGDIRILRQSIVHHRGIALKEVKKCEILKWFDEGDQIFIDFEKMKFIIYQIKQFTKNLYEEYQKEQ